MITGVKTKATIQENGITLIALVITIVILIILATVTMSFVFGEEGLIARAQQAAEMTEVQDIIEQMELAKAEVVMENGGKINVDDFFEKLEENEIIGSVENDVVDNGDGTYDIVTDDGYEFEVTVTPDGDIEIEYSGKGEGPRIRNINIEKASNSVTVTVETKNAEGGKFTYSYKKNSEGEESWQEAETNTSSNTCTIENLEANEIYNIKVKIETNKGTVERIINVQVGEMPVGKVNFSSYVWQGDGTANIVINTTEVGYTLQYQKVASGSSIQENNWTPINSGETITGLVYGDTVYGRLWDGTNESDYGNATIDDDIAPQAATIDLSGTTTDTEGSITATVTMADNESGVDITGSKWAYNTISTNIGTDEASYTNSFTTNPEEITLQATTVGTYYLHVLTKDVAGNKVEKISDAIIVEEPPKPGDPIDGTLATGPKVSDGMIPVKYIEGIGWVKTTSVDREWYNYEEKKWANVVLEDASFNASGSYEVLDESTSYSMLVWIPRYAYRITSNYHSGSTGGIDIEFLDVNNKTKDGTDFSSKVTYPSVTGGVMSDYVVHPAFDYGGKQLSGFWVGKFETSSKEGNSNNSSDDVSSKTIQIRAGTSSWRYISINNIFSLCLNMNRTGNPYGLNTSDNITDPHMMKNSEWGAVAYLSQSKFGKNSEIDVNTNDNYYTGGGNGTSYRTNQGQSTTGNITGIYDMSGGAWEHMASYINNSYATQCGSLVVSADNRYKDIYKVGDGSSGSSNYEATRPTQGQGTPTSSSGHFGDAVWETSNYSDEPYVTDAWNNDLAYSPDIRWAFYTRGGRENDGEEAGLFAFYVSNDIFDWQEIVSFRVVVPVLN